MSAPATLQHRQAVLPGLCILWGEGGRGERGEDKGPRRREVGKKREDQHCFVLCRVVTIASLSQPHPLDSSAMRGGSRALVVLQLTL